MPSDAETIRLAEWITAIRKDPKHPFNSRSDDAAHKEAVREMAELYVRLFPDQGGRACTLGQLNRTC